MKVLQTESRERLEIADVLDSDNNIIFGGGLWAITEKRELIGRITGNSVQEEIDTGSVTVSDCTEILFTDELEGGEWQKQSRHVNLRTVGGKYAAKTRVAVSQGYVWHVALLRQMPVAGEYMPSKIGEDYGYSPTWAPMGEEVSRDRAPKVAPVPAEANYIYVFLAYAKPGEKLSTPMLFTVDINSPGLLHLPMIPNVFGDGRCCMGPSYRPQLSTTNLTGLTMRKLLTNWVGSPANSDLNPAILYGWDKHWRFLSPKINPERARELPVEGKPLVGAGVSDQQVSTFLLANAQWISASSLSLSRFKPTSEIAAPDDVTSRLPRRSARVRVPDLADMVSEEPPADLEDLTDEDHE